MHTHTHTHRLKEMKRYFAYSLRGSCPCFCFPRRGCPSTPPKRHPFQPRVNTQLLRTDDVPRESSSGPVSLLLQGSSNLVGVLPVQVMDGPIKFLLSHTRRAYSTLYTLYCITITTNLMFVPGIENPMPL